MLLTSLSLFFLGMFLLVQAIGIRDRPPSRATLLPASTIGLLGLLDIAAFGLGLSGTINAWQLRNYKIVLVAAVSQPLAFLAGVTGLSGSQMFVADSPFPGDLRAAYPGLRSLFLLCYILVVPLALSIGAAFLTATSKREFLKGPSGGPSPFPLRPAEGPSPLHVFKIGGVLLIVTSSFLILLIWTFLFGALVACFDCGGDPFGRLTPIVMLGVMAFELAASILGLFGGFEVLAFRHVDEAAVGAFVGSAGGAFAFLVGIRHWAVFYVAGPVGLLALFLGGCAFVLILQGRKGVLSYAKQFSGPVR